MSQNKKNNKSKKLVTSKSMSKDNKKMTIKLPPADMNWYIMFEEEVGAAVIGEYLESLGYKDIDVWPDINIITIEMEDKTSLDFEPMEPFEAEEDIVFIEEHKIKTIYALTLSNGLKSVEKKICKDLFMKWNGLICGDSEDLTPVYKVEHL